MSHVLIVDDEPGICWGFREFLSDEGHEVSVASSAEEAFALVETSTPDAIVLDVRLPGVDGLSAIGRLRAQTNDAPIIIITAFGNLETAVRAVREGAFDYLPKPFDLDRAAAVVERALQSKTVKTSAAPVDLRETIVGSTPAMQDVFKSIALAAASEVPILVTGESGTGKELVARAIHQHGSRGNAPFIPVCLPALSPSLVESELFGHVKGAFTGAQADRTGLLELAAGGAVFLDEIGDAPLSLQVKLLRAIEQQEVTPVGEGKTRPIDARIIAATNRPLSDLIAAGKFREDLFFRLSVFEIEIPPLRQRRDDIPALARYFLPRSRADSSAAPLDDDVLDELKNRPWRGNVRELRNAIEHAAILSRGAPIVVEHLPAPSTLGENGVAPQQRLEQQISKWVADHVDHEHPDGLHEQFLALVEPPLIRAVLEHHANNRAATAQTLGIHRTTLRQKMRRYGIE